MGEYNIISSDNHLIEPLDLWTGRVDDKFRNRVPTIIAMEDGDWWFCDDHKVVGVALGTQTGERFKGNENLTRAGKFEDVRLGGYIPDEHVKDMDIDGVDLSVVYPTVGLLLYSIPDTELLTAICHAYNDYVADFCATYPKRIKGIGMLNVDNPDTAVKELERCAKLGLAGSLITVSPPPGMEYNNPVYENLWAAAEDIGMPLSLHLATNRPGPGQEFATQDQLSEAFQTNVDHWVRMSLAHIVFGGVFERHPKLQVGAVEHELSWVPHFLDRMDYTYTQRAQRPFWRRFEEDMLPSDYFHRNIFVGFQEDALGIQLRHLIGVSNLMWGSDYPHTESTFPKSREIIDEVLAECSQEDKEKIVAGNSARIYGFNLN